MSSVTKVEATGGGSGSKGLVGLDYQKIYEKTQNLTDIVFKVMDNGIYKGRAFGTEGERTAADRIEEWMIDFTDNLAQITDVTIEKPRIENKMNKKIEVLGFGLKLYDDTFTADIPNNESFPVVCYYMGSDEKTFTRNDIKVIKFPFRWKPPKSSFDVSYVRLNTSNLGLWGQEVVFIENYSNASENETFNRIHLINVSDDEYNDTVDLIANLNGTGFILMRDNVSNITSWDIPIPGVAVSIENASKIKNLATNESQFVEAETLYYNEEVIPETGTLTIRNISLNLSQKLGPGKKLFLITEGFWGWHVMWMQKLLRKHCAGILFCDPDTPNVHTMYHPHRRDQFPALFLGKLDFPGFYSNYMLPTISLNRSIVDNVGNNLDVFNWVINSDVRADFWI
jgi:hypothetical protein